MSEWWTYTVADLLMYSARTFYRLIERYNASLWPFQLVGLLAGITILAAALRRSGRHWRPVSVALVVAWGFVAIAWFWLRFRGISTGAGWFAAAFGLEALLLGVAAVRSPCTLPAGRTPAGWTGLALLSIATVGYPMIALASGRGMRQSEIFGVFPDPTAVATIGVLLLCQGRWRRRLLIIPVAWCLISGAMLWAMSRENSQGRTVKAGAPPSFSLTDRPRSAQSVASIASRRSYPSAMPVSIPDFAAMSRASFDS